MIRLLTAAFAAAMLLACAVSAHANDRAGPPPPSIYAPSWREGAPAIAASAAWRTGSSLVDEARRRLGSPKFTGLPGPWCADAVSAWLRGVGKPPLASRFAGAALSYGAPGDGSPGNLAVFMGRHGAYHVGVVIAERGSMVEVVAGNSVSWGHRVGVSWLPRNSLVYRRT